MVGSTIGWVVMIFGLDPTENSWHRYSRFCMRNRAHLAEMQTREKEDGATSDKERGESVGKIGNNSRKIICKRRLQVRPKIAPFARNDRFETLWQICCYLIQLPCIARCNLDRLYLRKRSFGNPRDLVATLFNLKFPAHLADVCVYTDLTCQV